MSTRRNIIVATLVAAAVSGTGFAWAACPATPDTSCKPALSASFGYTDSDTNTKDSLSFKLAETESTSPILWGHPTSFTTYDLCVYGDGVLLTTLTVPVPLDGHCDVGPCWVSKPWGPVYRDKEGVASGVTGAKLHGSPEGIHKTKIGVKGKGENLPDLSVPVTGPIVVQLRNDFFEGFCWAASFSGAEITQDAIKHVIVAKAKRTEFPTCSDAVRNGYESGVDCGGACSGCRFLDSCNVDGDCLSSSCELDQCAASCTDGDTNGDETDVDCGGDVCQPCGGCVDDSDCSNAKFCYDGLCYADPCTPGEFSCDGNSLMTCSADGNRFDFTAFCWAGCDPEAPDRPNCQCNEHSDCYDEIACTDGFCRNP